jgi:nicotinate dehydrogenase subunit A
LIYRLTINGDRRSVDVWDPSEPLLYVLRNELGLTGTKIGCGLGQCGTCTVLVDDRAVRSCMVPIASVAGQRVTTIEGLGTPDTPDALQTAFIAEQAAQCGYCTTGMIMRARALLRENPRPDAAAVKDALGGNLCRCGTHTRIVRAVLRAARGR